MMQGDYSSNAMMALLLTTLSGLSTGLGGLLLYLEDEPDFKRLGHLLSFASGVMLYISFMDMMPEAIGAIGFPLANMWFFVGMLLFEMIIRCIPEPKFPVDIAKLKSLNATGKVPERDLLRMGLITAVGISLHNFPEGIAVYMACLRGLDVGLPLALAIAAHNIPEGLAVAAPIYHATKSKKKAFMWALFSGFCEPIGAIVFGLFLTHLLTEGMLFGMYAAVSGIMVQICLRELLPTAFKHVKPKDAVWSSMAGMIFIAASVYMLNYKYRI